MIPYEYVDSQYMPPIISQVTSSFFFWVLITIFAGYAVILLLMYLFQSALVFFPTRQIIATPEDRGMAFEDVYLFTSDEVRIHGWFVPANDSRGTILFFHGNAGNISGRLESISIFHDLKLNVFIFDYRGYGNSEGKPSESGTYRDAEAAWNYLTQVREISADEIVLFGRSLGGGPASWLADRVDAAGLVLESVFTSAVDLARELYPFIPVARLMHIRYPVMEHVKKVDMPVMVAHSKTDEVIPYHHGERLFKAAKKPVLWVEMTGGHNDGFIQTGHYYTEGWEQFLQSVLD